MLSQQSIASEINLEIIEPIGGIWNSFQFQRCKIYLLIIFHSSFGVVSLLFRFNISSTLFVSITYSLPYDIVSSISFVIKYCLALVISSVLISSSELRKLSTVRDMV
eukprot:NODE_191_length_15469_cov_0.243071.p9 type:complete len:107 gc:universal NODE_191_length_15469_cov_0.243071:3260-2940(-)